MKHKKLKYELNVKGFEYINKTREYLDYLETHLSNVALAFEEVSKACDGMVWVGDDASWFGIRKEIEEHDLSKFSKYEFVQYRQKFFPVKDEVAFKKNWNKAWKHHLLCNNHHWQSIRYNVNLTGQTEHDIVHMVIDWTAMSYEFGGSAESYYEKNKDTIKIQSKFEPFLYEIFDRIKKKQYKHDEYTTKELFFKKLNNIYKAITN